MQWDLSRGRAPLGEAVRHLVLLSGRNTFRIDGAARARNQLLYEEQSPKGNELLTAVGERGLCGKPAADVPVSRSQSLCNPGPCAGGVDRTALGRKPWVSLVDPPASSPCILHGRPRGGTGITAEPGHGDVATAVAEIAVGKNQLDVQGAGQIKRCANHCPGYRALGAWLEDHRNQRVVTESTVRYHRAMHPPLHARGLEMALVNPLRTRRFTDAPGLPAKTDTVDAAALVAYDMAFEVTGHAAGKRLAGPARRTSRPARKASRCPGVTPPPGRRSAGSITAGRGPP